MANTSHLSSHEIIGGHSFLTTELNEGSGIFESSEPGARELTNREAAEFLIRVSETGSQPEVSNQRSELMNPIDLPKSKYSDGMVSQFIGNLIPGHSARSPYDEFNPIDTYDQRSKDGTAA